MAHRIVRFLEKPAPGTTTSNLINAGTYVFEPSVLGLIPPGQRVSVERDTFPRLVERGALFGAARDVYWLDAGRPDQYRQANLDLLDGKRLDRVSDPVAPGAMVAADANCSAASSVPARRSGRSAVLTGSIVLPGGKVGDRATVIDSIVMGTVGDGARLRNVVLGAEGVVAAGATVRDVRIPDPDAPTLPLDGRARPRTRARRQLEPEPAMEPDRGLECRRRCRRDPSRSCRRARGPRW